MSPEGRIGHISSGLETMAQWYLPSAFKALGSIPGTTHKEITNIRGLNQRKWPEEGEWELQGKGWSVSTVCLGRGDQTCLFTDLCNSGLASCVLVQLEFGSS